MNLSTFLRNDSVVSDGALTSTLIIDPSGAGIFTVRVALLAIAVEMKCGEGKGVCV